PAAGTRSDRVWRSCFRTEQRCRRIPPGSRTNGCRRRQLLRVVPEFVVEVMSPTDRLPAAKRKVRAWIANGVELGWLIHGNARCIYVFRQGCEARQLCDIERIAGEGPVDGFVLDLKMMW